jgi:hypothetical protein
MILILAHNSGDSNARQGGLVALVPLMRMVGEHGAENYSPHGQEERRVGKSLPQSVSKAHS